MKRLLKFKLILLVLVFTSANIGLMASHILGAEISYKQIKGNQYKFFLKVYRDCNECKFNNNGGGNNSKNCNEVPDLKINSALNSGGTEFLGEISMTRTKIQDITPTCYGVLSKCNIGSVADYGFEVHEFEGEFNFTNLLLQNKCNFDVSIEVSARNPAINSSLAAQNFFNFVSLNLCDNIPNQSTQFNLPPVFSLMQNQTHMISLGISNPDNDSLSFKLQPALVNRAQSLFYSAGRSSNQPYSVYCNSGSNCPANPNALPLAEGFYVSRNTGDVVFTPTVVNEGSVIVVECEEWKEDDNGNMYLAGVTRRDIYAEVVPPTNNLPRIRNKELLITLCESDVFNYQIELEDLKLFNINSDSVTVDIVTDLSELAVYKSVLSSAPYNYYRLNLSNSLGKTGKHFITISAKDNNCPFNGRVSRTIQLNILEKRKFDYTYKVKNCGQLTVESTIKNPGVRWTLCDINNAELIKQVGSRFNYQLLSGGKYILKINIDASGNLCALNKQDTLTIANFQNPEINLGANLNVCKNSILDIQPKVLKTYNTYKIFNDNTEVRFPFSYKAVNAKKLNFKIVQDDGCYAEVGLMVNINPVLERLFLSDSICTNDKSAIDLDVFIKADRSKIIEIEIASSSPEISISQNDVLNWDMKIILPQATSLNFTSIITDNYNCYYLDTFTLALIEPKPIDLKVPDKVCSNVNSIVLPSNASGSWTSANYPNNIAGNQFKIRPPYSGQILLEYNEHAYGCFNAKSYTIQITDTTAIQLPYPSKMSICENANPILLKAQPTGGKWSGNFISQNTFQPFSARNTINKLSYTYTNLNGCKSLSNMEIEVIGLPQLSIEGDKFAVCVGDELTLSALTDAVGLNGYWNTNGSGRFKNINQLSTVYLPSTADVQLGKVRFDFTLQTNTICGNLTQGIEVKINQAPTGKIITDYKVSQCEPATANFSSTYANLSKQYWYINDSLAEDFDYETAIDATLAAGVYNIKTKVFSGDCEASAILDPIIVYSKPVSNFISNPGYKISREYPRLFLKDISTSKNPFATRWFYNNQPIDQNKEFYYNVAETDKDTFVIKLVNISGIGACKDSIEKIFVFNPINQLYIPDAFSPDAKGPDENNEFKVKGPAMQHFYVEIFNKWGEMVYFSKDMNAAWDGTFGGKLAPQGVYIYKINSTDWNGVSRDYSGTITLIR